MKRKWGKTKKTNPRSAEREEEVSKKWQSQKSRKPPPKEKYKKRFYNDIYEEE